MNTQFKEQPKWYAVYTRSRAEKKLYSYLTRKGVRCFLPMTKVLKQYSDRKKWVREPLLRSYLFVQVNQREYFEVLNTSGAVRYVCFEGKAAAIPDNQIEALYNFVLNKPEGLGIEYGPLEAGDPMEVIYGPLKGAIGEVLQMRGSHRLLLRFSSLNLCVHTEVGLQDVRPLKNSVNVA